MRSSYLFGGDTGRSYEDLQRRRDTAEQLLASLGSRRISNVGEGIMSAAQAVTGALMDRRAAKEMGEQKSEFDSGFSALFDGASSAPSTGQGSAARQGGRGGAASVEGIDFGEYEKAHGLPAGYLGRTAQIESSGNPNAQNPNSSAGGLFQFIDSTAEKYGLSDRMNPVAATDAAARLARDNAATLRNALGRDPSAAELYLAHQQGGGGAAELLSNPNARAVDVVGADAVQLNGGRADMTAGQFANLWLSKFNGGQSRSGPQPASDAQVAQVMAVAQDPRASAQQKAQAQMWLQQQQQLRQAPDPLKQLQMERVQFDLDQARRAASAGPSEADQIALERARLALANDQRAASAPPERDMVKDAAGFWRYKDDKSRVFPDAEIPAKDPSSAEAELARIMELGYSREEAIRVKDLTSIVRHPTTGDPMLVSKIDGRPVQIEGSLEIQPVGDQQPTAQAPQVDNPFDAAELSFGLPGALKRGANAVTDALTGNQAFPEVGEAQAGFDILGEGLRSDLAASYGQRLPSWALQAIDSLIPRGGRVTTGAGKAQQQLRALQSEFDHQAGLIEQQLQGEVTPKVASDMELRLQSINRAKSRLDQALAGFAPDAESNQTSNGVKWRVVE